MHDDYMQRCRMEWEDMRMTKNDPIRIQKRQQQREEAAAASLRQQQQQQHFAEFMTELRSLDAARAAALQQAHAATDAAATTASAEQHPQKK